MANPNTIPFKHYQDIHIADETIRNQFISQFTAGHYTEALNILSSNATQLDGKAFIAAAINPIIAGISVIQNLYYDSAPSGFDEDFATVNPYLGSDGVKPFIDVCKEEKKGLFILVKTSNPSSGEFQDRLIDGRPLYEIVAEKVAQWGEEHMGEDYSYVGAVVGATYPEMGAVLRKLMPKNYILVPGYGAQGGTGKDLAPFFNEDGLGAIVNSSRGIICAYQKSDVYGPENFGDASRQAVLDMKEDLKNAFVK